MPASTGQLSAARTRETASGPNDTAPVPIIRQQPTGPAAPRPGVRQPEGQRPTGQPPVRSRLRTPPPVPPQATPRLGPALPPADRPPQDPRGPVRPAVPPAARVAPPATRPIPRVQARTAPTGQLRSQTARPVTQPFSFLAPAAAPLPPEPTAFAEAPARPRRRRGGKGLLAVLAVVGLASVWVLPAFASEALDPPPVAHSTDSDVQQLRVGDDVEAGGVSTDAVTGSAAVAAAGGTSSVGWMRPLTSAKLGDRFGPRPEQPVAGVSLFHRGQDLIAPCGTPIHAAAGGTVTTATWWGTYGNWILIDTGNGVSVGYAHESSVGVAVGQKVREGQVIGTVGQTGAATGCHLHLEVHLNGVAVNPVPFFTAKHIALVG